MATVSLGTFPDQAGAADAMSRAELMIKGASRCTEEEYKTHVEFIQRSQALLQNRIKESNGEFHVSLKIMGKSFELGPYPTAHEARMAHDRYSMVLDGASAQMFNTVTDVLLPKEESASLISALNKIRSGREWSAVALNSAPNIPQSSIVANAFTSTLRKVSSQSSLVDEAADLNKQLEQFASSVRANLPIVGHADSPKGGNPPADNAPFPLPAFPGVGNGNGNGNGVGPGAGVPATATTVANPEAQ